MNVPCNQHNRVSFHEIDDVEVEIGLMKIGKNVLIYLILNSSYKVHHSQSFEMLDMFGTIRGG